MSTVAEKERQITSYVNKHGFVKTAKLAEYFSLTPQSIRRYVNALSEKGHLKRTHGGVMRIDVGTAKSIQNNIDTGWYNNIKIESLALIHIELISGDAGFFDSLYQFLRTHSRVDPVVHQIVETKNCSWASVETDKILRKITREQVAIFVNELTETATNMALISNNRGKQTHLIARHYEAATQRTYILRQEGIGLLSFESFKNDWIYARF